MALQLDASTVTGIFASVLGVAGGVGLLIFYERQGLATAERTNTQPCVECQGETFTICNVCGGDGKNPLSRAETTAPPSVPKASSDSLPNAVLDVACTYCEGRGKIKCFNCGGTGIQPRFLDRLSPEDFMD